MPSIDIKHLTKKFGNLTAVNNVSLTIEPGEIFGLLGPNGAGKTTTLLILSTLLKPSSGKITVNGFDVLESPEMVRDSIGMVFQDPSSDELLSGYENLKLHALMYDVPMKEIDKRIDNVLKLVNLLNRKRDAVKKYSGGMRRRMEIARGLLHAPKILFLDEPTIGLDPQTRTYIWDYIRDLAKKMDMTIILTTHYMEEAEKLCNRIAIIDKGKIVALGTPDELRKRIKGNIITLSGKNINMKNLKRLSLVKKIELSDHRVRIFVDNASKSLQTILKAAGNIDSVEIHSPDLNDVFLHYTGKAIREEEGGAIEHIRTLSKGK